MNKLKKVPPKKRDPKYSATPLDNRVTMQFQRNTVSVNVASQRRPTRLKMMPIKYFGTFAKIASFIFVISAP